MADEARTLLTVKETALFLHVHQNTVYRLLLAQRLPGAFRISSEWRVDLDTLRAALRTGMDLSYK